MALHIRWTKYWSFSISPSNDYSGLIPFRIEWFDCLAVQGTLKSLHQHHNLESSIFRHSALFMVQLSHPDMTTGKTAALSIQSFVCKGRSLLFNMLSRFVIAFLLRNKRLLISRLQSPSAVIFKSIDSFIISFSLSLPLSYCILKITAEKCQIFLQEARGSHVCPKSCGLPRGLLKAKKRAF